MQKLVNVLCCVCATFFCLKYGRDNLFGLQFPCIESTREKGENSVLNKVLI